MLMYDNTRVLQDLDSNIHVNLGFEKKGLYVMKVDGLDVFICRRKNQCDVSGGNRLLVDNRK